MSVADVAEFEHDECSRERVLSRIRQKLLDRQKSALFTELKKPYGFLLERQKEAELAELDKTFGQLEPGEHLVNSSSVAMAGVAGGATRARRYAADSACNVHLTGDESDLKNANFFHFKVVRTARAPNVTKPSTVVGSALDAKGGKGSALELEQGRYCTALSGLSINLLSICQILADGSVVHLEE